MKTLTELEKQYEATLKRMVELRMTDPKGIPFNQEYHKLNTLRADLKRQILLLKSRQK